MNKLLVLFIILSIANVIIQTVKSLATVKCGKNAAAAINAFAYGLYTVVLVYTNADFPLWQKVIITAFVNLIGVWIVKYVEEKMRKDKLWKVEMTLPRKYLDNVCDTLDSLDIPYNWIDIDKWYLFNVYCLTQKESALVKEVVNRYHAKYFVTESKNL